jgi:hypothetical protein
MRYLFDTHDSIIYDETFTEYGCITFNELGMTCDNIPFIVNPVYFGELMCIILDDLRNIEGSRYLSAECYDHINQYVVLDIVNRVSINIATNITIKTIDDDDYDREEYVTIKTFTFDELQKLTKYLKNHFKRY